MPRSRDVPERRVRLPGPRGFGPGRRTGGTSSILDGGQRRIRSRFGLGRLLRGRAEEADEKKGKSRKEAVHASIHCSNQPIFQTISTRTSALVSISPMILAFLPQVRALSASAGETMATQPRPMLKVSMASFGSA